MASALRIYSSIAEWGCDFSRPPVRLVASQTFYREGRSDGLDDRSHFGSSPNPRARDWGLRASRARAAIVKVFLHSQRLLAQRYSQDPRRAEPLAGIYPSVKGCYFALHYLYPGEAGWAGWKAITLTFAFGL